jgi:hypothetical protein
MHRVARIIVISRCLSHRADCRINPRLQAGRKRAGLKDIGLGSRSRELFA